MAHYLQWLDSPIYIGRNCLSKPLYTQRAGFVSGETIECNPPYIRGQLDSKWVRWSGGNKPNKYSKEGCEAVMGMLLLPIPEGT
jgi:hypothetical protein